MLWNLGAWRMFGQAKNLELKILFRNSGKIFFMDRLQVHPLLTGRFTILRNARIPTECAQINSLPSRNARDPTETERSLRIMEGLPPDRCRIRFISPC